MHRVSLLPSLLVCLFVWLTSVVDRDDSTVQQVLDVLIPIGSLFAPKKKTERFCEEAKKRLYHTNPTRAIRGYWLD